MCKPLTACELTKQDMIHQVDRNKTGMIEFDEFCQLCANGMRVGMD